MTEQLALRFLDNFSLLLVGENKIPVGTWKEYQTEKISVDLFKQKIKDPKVKGLGIITGFEFLEVIDVDLKVFSTPKEMEDFWEEYITTLKENIYDFENKIVCYKTKSGGYHLLYKSKRVVGNSKLAKLKGHKECVIETRGVGGYVFVYPENKVFKKSYFDVDFITDADHEIIWNVSKSYNYQEKEPEKVDKKITKNFSEGKTPWDDFNSQFNCIDVVVPEDFIIPNRGVKSKHTLIKRHGSASPHSGYVFSNSGCMYLFSTGTIYPHEKLLTPFATYAFKHHNGDFSAAAKDLYEQGFGERQTKKIEDIKPELTEKIEIKTTEFPAYIFPPEMQFYFKECSDKLQMNIDYMGCSFLWLLSVICGNSYEIEVKAGWREKAILWLALVGKAGVGKTPSIDKIIFPLSKLNNKEIKKYIEEKEKFDEFNKLTKKEKTETYGESYKVSEPKKTQFIVNDITLEALVQMHQQSDNSVGVFKDELAGWLKDMNKYRSGSDLEFWLSSWSSKAVSLNRKTADSNFVDKPFIPVLGGIQPTIFNNLSTEENKENGFMDRLLLAYPEINIDYYSETEIDYKLMLWYNELIVKFYKEIKGKIIRKENDIEPFVVKMDKDAKIEWKRIFNKITDHQNDDNENQYLKSMYPKQKSYTPRFALLIYLIDRFMTDNLATGFISKDDILKAEILSDYFVNNAKKVKIDSTETKEIKQITSDKKSNFDKVKAIYELDPEFNRSKLADLLGISRQQIIKLVKKCSN